MARKPEFREQRPLRPCFGANSVEIKIKKLAPFPIMFLISACSSGNEVQPVPDLSGTYRSAGCIDIQLYDKSIKIGRTQYPYNVINIKGVYYLDIDGTIVYKSKYDCSITHDKRQRYIKMIASNGGFDMEIFSTSLDSAILFRGPF